MKAALLFYMKSLSRKLGRKGIRVNAVSPGPIYFDGGFWQDVERNQPDVYREVVEENAMRRMGKPEEIAKRTFDTRHADIVELGAQDQLAQRAS